jgi:dTDP-4-dehydrorhamnose 3,5-epimerase-like enzyme
MSHTILEPTFQRRDGRGLFQEVLNDGTWESIVSGRMNAGAIMGNHYHKKTLVFFFLYSGSADIRTVHIDTNERDAFTLNANQGVMLHTNESHAITFTAESDFLLLKSLRYDPDDPDTYEHPVL